MIEDFTNDINPDTMFECLTKLYTKVSELCEARGWEEPIDMMVSQLFSDNNEEPKELYRRCQFMIMLSVRLEKLDKMDFNSMADQDDRFMVMNYDYKSFVWAVEHGLSDTICPSFYTIPKSVLAPQVLAKFEERCKQ